MQCNLYDQVELKIIVSRVLVFSRIWNFREFNWLLQDTIFECFLALISLWALGVWTCSNPMPRLKKAWFEKLGSRSIPKPEEWGAGPGHTDYAGLPMNSESNNSSTLVGFTGTWISLWTVLGWCFKAYVCFWNNVGCIFLTLLLRYLWNLKSKDAQLLDRLLQFCV